VYLQIAVVLLEHQVYLAQYSTGHLSVCQSEDLQCIEPLTIPTAFLLKGPCPRPAELCWVDWANLAPGEHSTSRQSCLRVNRSHQINPVWNAFTYVAIVLAYRYIQDIAAVEISQTNFGLVADFCVNVLLLKIGNQSIKRYV